MYRLLLISILLSIFSSVSYAHSFSLSNLKEDPFSSEPLDSDKNVLPLRQIDIDKSAQQRNIIRDLAARYLGKSLLKEKHNDLEVLQLLLDKRIIKKTDRFTLQAMGVVLGDV